MTTFDEREKAFEKAYAHDAEIRFKVHSRCAKSLAQWAADQLALSPPEAAEYVRKAIAHDMKKEGIDDLIEFIQKDFESRGQKMSVQVIKGQAQVFLAAAKKELMS